jgi:HK97 family phage portal protein
VTVLRSLVRNEERAIQATPWGNWAGEGGGTFAGPRVDTTSALQLLTVYGCNRFIAEGISTLPVDVFRKTTEGREPAPAPPWLEQPTADLDRVSWLTQILTSLLLDGDAFLRLVYDSNFNLSELVPLDPGAVEVRRNERTKRKEYLIGGRPVDGFEVLHIPGLMRPGTDRGMSPVEAARQTIGSGLSIKEFAGRFFSQGMSLSGVIESPAALTPDQAKQMAASWARAHSGKNKSHLPGVLEGGATWKATGVTNEQAQFLQTQQFTAAEIASFMFLIDPTEFGVSIDKGSSITYANLEQRNVRKVSVTFLPWMVRLEHALSSLMGPSQKYMKFNVNALLRGDLKTRYDSYAVGITSGFLGADEAREFEDLPPRDDLQPAAPVPQGEPT